MDRQSIARVFINPGILNFQMSFFGSRQDEVDLLSREEKLINITQK